MPTLRGAHSYAQAIFQLAREQDRLGSWDDDLTRLAVAVGEAAFLALMDMSKVPLEQRMEQAATLVPGLSPHALNLLGLLLTKGRLKLLPLIRSAYGVLLDEHRGVEEVQMVTAVPMEAAELEALRRRLGQLRAKEVRLLHRVDPAILGGLIIRVGDRLLDGSVRGRLQALHRGMAGSA